MKRRTLSSITEYLYPSQIFELINRPGWDYGITKKEFYQCRDRGFMAALYCSVGRVTAVCGGPKYHNPLTEKADGVHCVVCGRKLEGRSKVYCSKECTEESQKHMEIVGHYTGLTRNHLEIIEKFITVRSMEVVKRSDKIIAKRGPQVAIRPLFRVPLKCDLYENEYWDQLVPFGWLILEYVKRFEPEGRLFPFYRGRAWQIVEATTGMFNHWFRAQAEQFYGTYLFKDSVKLSKFVRVKLKFTVPYVDYDPDAQLKGKERMMDFEWIDRAVDEIKSRMEVIK